MTIKHLIFLFISAIAIGCTKVEKETVIINEDHQQSSIPKNQGTDTGGGGFADQSAIDALNLAKHTLAQRIENLPDSAFTPYTKQGHYQFGLPEGKRKAWLLKTIRGVKLRRVFDERYDKPLKFNYDKKTEEVYATNYFIQNFAYGRFQNSLPIDKIRLIHEIFLDILHEVSHFYGVGLSEQLDYQSDQWAMDFLTYGMDAFYRCRSHNDYVFMINKSSGMTFVRHDPLEPWTTLVIHKTPELTTIREGSDDSSKFRMKIIQLPRENHWKDNTGLITYTNYDLLPESYAMDLYQQYVALASMKGKEDIPKYMRVTRNEFLPNPHKRNLNFINQYLNQVSNYTGSIFGYPIYKEQEGKFVVFRKGQFVKDYFELDINTLEATYNVGQRESKDDEFIYSPSKEMKMDCQDFHKPIVISKPEEGNSEYWEAYVE